MRVARDRLTAEMYFTVDPKIVFYTLPICYLAHNTYTPDMTQNMYTSSKRKCCEAKMLCTEFGKKSEYWIRDLSRIFPSSVQVRLHYLLVFIVNSSGSVQAMQYKGTYEKHLRVTKAELSTTFGIKLIFCR